MTRARRPLLLVLASTYPRWKGDHEPGFVHALSQRLTGAFEVIVLTSHAPGAQQHEFVDGVEVVRYRYAPLAQQTLVYGGGMLSQLRRKPWKLFWLPAFVFRQWSVARRLIRTRGIDVVHAHWIVPQGLVGRWAVAGRSRDTGLVVTVHGSDVFRFRGWPWTAIKRDIARHSRRLTVVSPALREEVERQGMRGPRIDVMPMGVDMRHVFRPDPGHPRSRHEILFVGRLIAQKGLSWLLSALPAIRAACPQVRLKVAGGGPDLAASKLRVQALGLEDVVQFLGAVAQEHLPGLYRQAAVCVAPFLREEGLGMVVLEAAACECPLVVGDTASMRTLFAASEPVARVPVGDVERLADSVVRQLQVPAPAQQRARLRERLLQTHDWEAVASAYAGLLQASMRDAPPNR